MVSFINEKNLKALVGVMVFLIPAGGLIIDHMASHTHGYLALFTLAILPYYKIIRPLTAVEKYFLAVLLMFSAWPFLSWFIGDSSYYGTKSLGVYIRWLFFIPVYFLFRRLQLSINWLMYALIFGAIAAGISAVAEIVLELDSIFPGRASGAVNPLYFGNLALLMGVMSLSFWPVCKSKRCMFVLIAALSCGVIASLLSGSRGGWVAMPFLFAFLIWQLWFSLSNVQRVALMCFIVILPVAVYLVPQFGIDQRLLLLQSDIDNYVPGELKGTAIGVRLEVWQAAITLFLQHPIFGVGLGNFIHEFELLIAQEVPKEFTIYYMHAHNEFLSALAERGIIGLVIVLSVFVLPGYIFYKQRNSADDQIRALSYAGLSLLLGYFIISLSDIGLSRSLYVSFYSYCIIFIVSAIYSRLANRQ